MTRLARGQFPRPNRRVPTARGDGPAVRRNGHLEDEVIVRGDLMHCLPRGRVPDANFTLDVVVPVAAAGDEPGPVRREGQGPDPERVPRQLPDRLAGLELP